MRSLPIGDRLLQVRLISLPCLAWWVSQGCLGVRRWVDRSLVARGTEMSCFETAAINLVRSGGALDTGWPLQHGSNSLDVPEAHASTGDVTSAPFAKANPARQSCQRLS